MCNYGFGYYTTSYFGNYTFGCNRYYGYTPGSFYSNYAGYCLGYTLGRQMFGGGGQSYHGCYPYFGYSYGAYACNSYGVGYNPYSFPNMQIISYTC